MLTFTLWLLFIATIIGLIYWHFSKRAAEIKRNIDQFVREAGRLAEQRDLRRLVQLRKDLREYGETFCVNRPWFGLYGYYVEAEWIVSGQAEAVETVLVAENKKGRGQIA